MAGTKRACLFRSALSTSSIEADCIETLGPGDAERLARKAAAQGYRIVVAAGGDGTVNEVGRGLIGTDSALAIVPTGSGNGLARHLNVPLHLSKALADLAQPKFDRIDVGEINGHRYFCTAGIGFDAHVARHFAEAKARGLSTYVKTVLSRYRQYQATEIVLTFDDQQLVEQCYVLAFANASQYGNNAYIAPHADLKDGLLDLCLIGALPWSRAISVAYALLAGTLPASRHAIFRSANAVAVSAAHPMEYHADGEFLGEANEFRLTLTPSLLEIATGSK